MKGVGAPPAGDISSSPGLSSLDPVGFGTGRARTGRTQAAPPAEPSPPYLACPKAYQAGEGIRGREGEWLGRGVGWGMVQSFRVPWQVPGQPNHGQPTNLTIL